LTRNELPVSGLKLEKKKLFTPNQVLACSFFGGPMAMIYALWKNFQVLEQPRDMQHILFWGSLFIVLLLLFSPFIPDWAEIVVPIAYSFAARSIAQSHQMTKQAIRDSADYEVQPTLNVAAVCIVFFVAFVILTFAFVFALISAGVIEP
jgi:hypothetical protein